MKLKTIFAAAAGLACSVAADAQNKDYVLNVGDFNELKVVSSINVDHHVSVDSAGMVCFTADPSVASFVTASVKKGRLRIEVIPPEGAEVPDALPTVHVYSGSLLRVENEGDSAVRVLSPVAVPNFTARLIGNGGLSVRAVRATGVDCSLLTGRGRMVIGGSCTEARFSLAGVGSIQADGLKAEEASCLVTGTGDIGVNADRIKVSGAGSGTVYYLGNPTITKTLVIGVKILPLE